MTADDHRKFKARLLNHMRANGGHAHFDGAMPVGAYFDSWLDGVYPDFRPCVDAAVADDDVKLHDHANAVISSMVFGFNLFLPFRCIDMRPLGRLLSAILGFDLVIGRLTLEYYGSLSVLGELPGEAPEHDAHFTASDIGIEVTREDGRKGLILIEVKLTEPGFTHCGGRDSSYNTRRDVCDSAVLFFDDPNNCYLTQPKGSTHRRYWEIFSAASEGVRQAFPNNVDESCPFAGDRQQIMRNHALALGSVQNGHFDFCHFGLVHHDDNPSVVPIWEDYCSIMQDASMLFRIPASRVIAWVQDDGELWGRWATDMRKRYLLPMA